MGVKMLDDVFSCYVLQLKMKRDTWLDVHEFPGQVEAAQALMAAQGIDKSSVFRLVRIWR
jgi:hypothetical protein